MKKSIRFVGLDVHAETIAVAVAEGREEVRSLGTIANRPEAVRRLVRRLEPVETLRVCYEAGPTGYALYWELTKLGVRCDVVAPSLVPMKAGDRVKTDRRDAEKLARSYRSGDLTMVWVPDAAHEALRDLVRTREAGVKDELRARHRLVKFLLRQGRRAPEGTKSWSERFFKWARTVEFEHKAQNVVLADLVEQIEHQSERLKRIERAIDAAVAEAPAALRTVIEALQSLRGVGKLTATTLVTEVGNFSRFARPKLLMSYAGMTPSERSSGQRTARGTITKAGNSHLRRIVIESAWHYRHRPRVGAALRQRQRAVDGGIREISSKAQHRLHARYWRLTSKGKPATKAVTAVARELLGFMWAVAVRAEQQVAA